MFSNILQTASNTLNSIICVVHFSNSFNSVLHKRVLESYWCSSSIVWQEKRADWILRIFTFNDKNALYLPIITTLQSFFQGQWSRINPIRDKTTWHIPNIQNSRFKLKKCQFFPNFFLFFINNFRQYLT